VFPFAKTGGLADVAGALPQALFRLGLQNTVITPAYQMTLNRHFNLTGTGLSFRIPMPAGLNEQVQILSSDHLAGVKTYFISHPLFSQRAELYGLPDDYGDNGYRFALFCKAALELIKILGPAPDIIHCHDWQTGLVPPLMETQSHGGHYFSTTGRVFTIHNLAYQGLFPRGQYQYTGLPDGFYRMDGLEFYGQVNYLKGGIFFADRLTTVSPTYAREILTPDQGWSLDGALSARQDRLSGILNGLDYAEWNPAADKLLPMNYDAARIRIKQNLKRMLGKKMGLVSNGERPLLAVVSRLARQKGLDLVLEAFDDIMEMGCDLVLLGTGEQHYHQTFEDKKRQYPNSFGLRLGYDESLSHLIYAGSDIFLMPSQYEPCGLGQMIALRYGTIPVVRRTGGLADTISDYDVSDTSGNGFAFDDFSSQALRLAVTRAVRVFRDRDKWDELVRRSMNCDFSWETSARKYHELYLSLSKPNPKSII
jgi:starch synthase